jgi:hypothetical protein
MSKYYIDFFHDLFEKEKNCIPNFYSKVTYRKNDFVLHADDNESNKLNLNICYLKYIPDYLKLQLKNNASYKVKKIRNVKGYSIFLKKYSNLQEYLNSQFKSKQRSAIRKYVRRLEASFDINYKMFYGTISSDDFEFLFQALREMLDKRFEERKSIDINRSNWKQVGDNIFKLINQKKASLFVVYNGGIPIAITANYHFNHKIFFYGIPSYNIDYSIFRLGHVVIYKELEWCFENNYLLFETGRGDLDYKRRWCDSIYYFDYHIIYKKKNLSSYILYKQEAAKLNFIDFLKKYKVNKIVYKLRNSFSQSNKSDYKIDKVSYTIIDIDRLLDNFKTGDKIDLNINKYSKLLRPINEFIYKSLLNISDVEVFEVKENQEFLIVANNKKALLKFK